jgi:hypothetical protein
VNEIFGNVREVPENPARERALLLTAMVMERKPGVLDRFIEGIRELDDRTVVADLWKLFSGRCWEPDVVYELVRICVALRIRGLRDH